MKGAMLKRLNQLVGCSLATLLAGCATTYQSATVRESGFLGDYSLLCEGAAEGAPFIYINPRVGLSSYTKVLVEPVTIWADANLEDVPQEDQQRLANYLREAITAKLEEDYTVVEEAGPGVLRIRVAITEAVNSNVPLDIVSTVIPQTRVISELKRLVTGTHAFVGKASVEGEITDSLTGTRLLGAADRRTGGKTLAGSTNTWGDVEAAYDYWADELRRRLRTERAKRHSASTAF